MHSMMHRPLILAGEARTHTKNTDKVICPQPSGAGRMVRCLHTTAELAWYWCIIQKLQRSLEPLRPTVKALDLAETNMSSRTSRIASGRGERKAGCRCTSSNLCRLIVISIDQNMGRPKRCREYDHEWMLPYCRKIQTTFGSHDGQNIGVCMKRNSIVLELQNQRVCTQKGAHIIAYPIDGPWTYVV